MERKQLFPEAIESSITEAYGCDLLAGTAKGLVGAQIKRVPNDLVASLEDGRLGKELEAMRNIQFPVLILEGKFRYTDDNYLIVNGKPSRFTRKGIVNLIRSAHYQFEVWVEYSNSIEETVVLWSTLVEYIESNKHTSLYTRPSIKGAWGVPTLRERELYWVQGLPNVGVDRGARLLERFSPIEIANARVEELCAIEGIGKQTAEKIYKFFRRLE